MCAEKSLNIGLSNTKMLHLANCTRSVDNEISQYLKTSPDKILGLFAIVVVERMFSVGALR